MKRRWLGYLIIFLLSLTGATTNAQFSGSVTGWPAGFAKSVITTTASLWLTGYASRNKPREGTLRYIYAKALALEDQRGNRLVIVTTDLLGIPRAMGEAIAE